MVSSGVIFHDALPYPVRAQGEQRTAPPPRDLPTLQTMLVQGDSREPGPAATGREKGLGDRVNWKGPAAGAGWSSRVGEEIRRQERLAAVGTVGKEVTGGNANLQDPVSNRRDADLIWHCFYLLLIFQF